MRQSLPFRAAFWAPLDPAHFPYDRHALPLAPSFRPDSIGTQLDSETECNEDSFRRWEQSS